MSLRHDQHRTFAHFRPRPQGDGTTNSDVDLAIALAAIEDAALKTCGGFTIHRGKGGWIDPAGKLFKEDLAILIVSGSYTVRTNPRVI